MQIEKSDIGIVKKKQHQNYFIYLKNVGGEKEINAYNESLPAYKESHEF